MSLAGRVALVTGGSRGIGRAIALGLAADGADIAVNYRRDDEAAHATVADIQALGRKAIAVRAAVGEWQEDQEMVATVEVALGPVGILVNNAGQASRGLSVVDTDPDEPGRLLATHALGAHHLSALVLPAMRSMERGDIVMVSSVATVSLGANGAPYNMAKAALEALAATLAKEERPFGVHVNVVAPGLVETDMGRRLMRAIAGVEDLRTLDESAPFGRVCQPEDVADVVRFVVSDQARYMTGQRLGVDGGGALR
jgi:3-oxoacyl-[acyl-carrier protein] reductase